MRAIVFGLLLSSLSHSIIAQEFDISLHINRFIQQGDEAENQTYYNLLLYYYDNPIDINNTNSHELRQLNILDDHQILELLNHIKKTGEFASIYELQTLESFSLTTIRSILPFITVGTDESLVKVFKGIAKSEANYAAIGYSRVVQLSKAYNNQIYHGSPDRLQTRIRLRNPGHLSIGLTSQKDPGEPWISKSRIPSPDYVSGHIYLENQGRIKQMVLGDFRLQFGQGLVLGAGFMVGKNAETVSSVKQSSLGILPYSSISEANFFRGVGTNIKLSKHIQLALFYSNQHLDATLTNDSSSLAVSSIRSSGLHRTTSEIEAMNKLHEQVWGSAIIYDKKNFSTGLLLVNSEFDKMIIPAHRNYNLYNFRGNKLLNYGWFGQYRIGNFLVFSEVAKTHNAGFGVNLGLIGAISKYVSLSMLYRSFEKNFHSLYGSAFSERSSIGNENGLFWGIKIYPNPKMTFSGYYDMYRFPWLTSRTAAPSFGHDYLIRFEYKLNEHTNILVQLRHEKSDVKVDVGLIGQNQPVQLTKSIINFDYNLESPLTFRTRVQYNLFKSENIENGWLMYQDINYSKMKFGFTARILVFDTESYAARQYVYEKDMLFSFNTNMFNGKGVSYYLILKYKPFRNATIRLKWSNTEYYNQHTIGSGNDLIIGDNKTQITGQVHFTF